MNNRYNITVAEKYTDNTGEEKTHFTKVGTAFYNKDSDTFSCKIVSNLSITGEFVLFKDIQKKKNK